MPGFYIPFTGGGSGNSNINGMFSISIQAGAQGMAPYLGACNSYDCDSPRPKASGVYQTILEGRILHNNQAGFFYLRVCNDLITAEYYLDAYPMIVIQLFQITT